MSIEQLSFLWADSPVQPTEQQMNEVGVEAVPPETATADSAIPGLVSCRVKQSILAFLLQFNPSTIAQQVPLRKHKYKLSAAAAFYTSGGAKRRFCIAAQTVAVDIFTSRSECLPECSEHMELFAQLDQLRQEQTQMEADIRHDEPELKVSGDLFADSEAADYDYKNSRLHPYCELQKRIEKTLHVLYRGSRMEIIRRSGVADRLYLAVPANLITQNEVAPGWGLVYIHQDYSCSIELEAPSQTEWVEDAARNHLALNIARANLNSLLFANGVRLKADGKTEFTLPPRRRRKKLE